MSTSKLIEKGIVTKVEEQWAWVNTKSKLACSSCQVESTCGNGILEKYLAGKVFVSKIQNRLDAKVGDQVELSIPQTSVTMAAVYSYFIPLLGLFLGAWIAELNSLKEPLTIACSFVGFLSGLWIMRQFGQKVAQQESFLPKMVSKRSTGLDVTTFDLIRVKQVE